MPKPSICQKTIENLVHALKNTLSPEEDSIDAMIAILKTDPYWQLASEEQCLTFITKLVEGLTWTTNSGLGS
jgi:hypothetical protein